MAKPYAVLHRGYQLDTAELLSRCASVPSRQDLVRGPELRTDLAENVSRTYDTIWRHAHASRNLHICTSWQQFAVACGYEPTAKVIRSMIRYLELMAEAGLLTFGGKKDFQGRWRRLEILLLAPPELSSGRFSPCSSTGRASATPVICLAERREESLEDRVRRRVRPWRRQGGRGRSVPRWDLSWDSKVLTPKCSRRELTSNGRTARETRARVGDQPVHVAATTSRPTEREPRPSDFDTPHRYAALSRLRTAARGGGGLERLRDAVRAGAPPAAVTVAAFEARWGASVKHDAATPVALGARLSSRWASRLEWAVARLDREAGEPGTAMLWLLDSMEGHSIDWRQCLKRVDAPAGATRSYGLMRPDGFESVTLPNAAMPVPQSAAFFVQKLYREAKVRRIRDRGAMTWDEIRMADRSSRERDAAAARDHLQAERAGTLRPYWED